LPLSKAQIGQGRGAGVVVSPFGSHLGSFQFDPGLFEVYLKLYVEFYFPVGMEFEEILEKFTQPELRGRVAARGIFFPDYFIYEELPQETKDVKGFWMKVVSGLKPGITELYIHAAKPTEELQAITGSWRTRSAEFEVFAKDQDMQKLINDQKIIRIGY